MPAWQKERALRPSHDPSQAQVQTVHLQFSPQDVQPPLMFPGIRTGRRDCAHSMQPYKCV